MYNISPAYPIEAGRIRAGYESLATAIAGSGARLIALDGFGGNDWTALQQGLAQQLNAHWVNTADYFLPEDELLKVIGPSLGGNDPLFGRLFEGGLPEFFNMENVATRDQGLTIVYGPGAALFGQPDLLLYVDLPKDEIQARARAKAITNLGAAAPADFGSMYKRFFFVDWPALNRHKAALLPAIDWFVDGTDAANPIFVMGDHLRAALTEMAGSYFRVRPWFYPGPWGGQYMKRNFPGLPQEVPNYAWSFELIVPENGLVLESGEHRLECSFDLLMFQHYKEVLGQAAERFVYNFPIRFDYLDTIEGGNLSVQCHPRRAYIKENFGEPFTQDESYYIVTCEPGAKVYLGFRDGLNQTQFRAELERSHREGTPIDADRYINSVEAHPHDLFLIPGGTVHGAGAGNLVLEISNTPYIYTFKMYDWVRRDLQGKLRPLNFDRAWANLDFDRQEQYVAEKLCPTPMAMRSGPGWQEVFVGTHPDLFFAVDRLEFTKPVAIETQGKCHILNLVEGEDVELLTQNGHTARFSFGETFVVPAAAGGYTLRPAHGNLCKVVKAYVK